MFPVDCPLNHYWILLVFVSSLRGGFECPKGIRVAELNMGTVVEPTNMVI